MIVIRPERDDDIEAIRRVTEAAFRGARHSDQTEGRIVDALRAAGALTLSLIAVLGEDILGHAGFSPVRINGADLGWQGLGPVSVRPDRQGEGIGQAVVRDGLRRLKEMDIAGCVVFGSPAYYGRFGFESDPALAYAGAPPGYFQRLVFRGKAPAGEVAYHSGFDVS